MLEVAVCLSDLKHKPALYENMLATAGSEFRANFADNSDGRRDIFIIYDEIVRSSNADIILFCHQDIRFCSTGWVAELEKLFAENPELGGVGVVGGVNHSAVPGNWFTSGTYPAHFFQSDLTGRSVRRKLFTISSGENVRVTALDGVFMAFRREVFKTCSFLESGLTGYHGYDLDICLQLIREKWQIMVTGSITIEHLSCGSFNKQYVAAIESVHRRFADMLPVFAGQAPSKAEQIALEYESLYYWGVSLLKAGFPQRHIRKELSRLSPGGIRYASFAVKIRLLLLFLSGGLINIMQKIKNKRFQQK